MNGTPDLNLLRRFVAIAQSTSFSAAAQKLGLPKSTMSRSVARLEQELGTRLLHRTTHAVGLTTAGAALLERVAPLLGSLETALSSLPEQTERPSGLLRITAAPDFAAAMLAPLVARFAFLHPDIRVEARLTTEYLDLVAEGFDLALRASSKRLADSRLVARRMGRVELQLFASPAYLSRRGVPRNEEELQGHEFVLFPRARRMPELRMLPAARIVADDFFYVRETLRAGGGIGVLPVSLSRGDMATGDLVRVLPRFVAGTGTMYLVHPHSEHVPAKVTAFRDFLLENLAARP